MRKDTETDKPELMGLCSIPRAFSSLLSVPKLGWISKGCVSIPPTSDPELWRNRPGSQWAGGVS